jgi:hypothetical protein
MKKALVLVLTQDPSLMQGPNNTTNSAGIFITGKKLFLLFLFFLFLHLLHGSFSYVDF